MIMTPFCLFGLVFISALTTTTTTNAYERAEPAIQYRRSLASRVAYQGGWPLALTGSNSPSCPGDTSVACSPTDYFNPACCPTGQICFAGQDTQYCCPTNIDCTTAVNNFPICANSTWNMFVSSTGGYFCCSPGQIGVNDMTMTGGLCEPYDQVVPSNLLATLVSQATATAAAISGTASATATSGAPLETNPTLSPTASDSGAGGLGDSALNSGSYVPLSTPAIIGIGVGASIAITVVIVIGICLRRRPKKIIVNEAFLCTPYEPNFPDQYCSRHEVVHKLPPYTAMETAGGG